MPRPSLRPPPTPRSARALPAMPSTRRRRACPSGAHGTPIWQRKLTGAAGAQEREDQHAAALQLDRPSTARRSRSPARSRSRRARRRRAAGRSSRWAHGTVGIADACAPCAIGTQANYDSPLLNRWLKAGYAVVRTDYEGLGTPGEHPYLIGVSEGRSVLDMVARRAQAGPETRQAARDRRPLPGRPRRAVGRVAGEEVDARAQAQGHRRVRARSTTSASRARSCARSPSPSGLSGLAAMILRGIDIAQPDAGHRRPALTDRAKALYPQIDDKCLDGLGAADSVRRPRAGRPVPRRGAPLDPSSPRSNANDPENLKIPGPVLIEQGKADTTVLPDLHGRSTRPAS